MNTASSKPAWFARPRLGMFVHFGLYAIAGWHEQDQMRRHIPRAEYARLLAQYNPVQFDPDALLDLAQCAGMEYLCFTTKHHDGFCLWGTQTTDYNVMRTPYGKDVTRQVADACHRRKMPLGLYYSVADWHHPNYPNSGRHHELAGPEPGDRPDWNAYMAYLIKQVRELCSNYGPVRHFFWDMNVPQHRDPSVNAMLRGLQPGIVINDRGFDEGDFGTPERNYHPEATAAVTAFTRPTEACNSVGTQSWGYRADEDYYCPRYLMQQIDAIMAKGGHYLLNVGPDGHGQVPAQAVALLEKIGRWYHAVREAFDGCHPANELVVNRDVLLTARDHVVYVHVVSPPASDAVILHPLAHMPRRATLLNTGAPVSACVAVLPMYWQTGQPCLRLHHLPLHTVPDEVPVIKLEFAAPLHAGATTHEQAFQG